ncbi:hypothetical protein AMTR_s00232p00000850 [Amborella trichopoda]|uniref:Pentatricopeptide repeat-containing protein n=1 Tax=Amborella trichopoda TaxID=13333 RepID=W1NXQ9_AMBTC|nr:hypothetical protein AMTR_s00232p00000850 [Amborella trichopoda]
MEEAWHCVEEMGKLGDDVSFNSLIAGYARLGKGELSLVLYVQFLRTRLIISQFTFAGVLSACAGISGLVEGKQIHALVFKTGFEGNIFVANAVMDMYAKSGELESSWRVFVHCKTIHCGLESDVFVSNAIIDMNAKCGSLESAMFVFNERSNLNTISWTALIAGYAQNGFNEEAIKLFTHMLKSDFKPDNGTFASVLSSCAGLTALNYGKQLATHIMERMRKCLTYSEQR